MSYIFFTHKKTQLPSDRAELCPSQTPFPLSLHYDPNHELRHRFFAKGNRELRARLKSLYDTLVIPFESKGGGGDSEYYTIAASVSTTLETDLKLVLIVVLSFKTMLIQAYLCQ